MSVDPEALPCIDKVTFDSVAIARAAAILAEKNHGIKLKVYRCRHCGLWHLAST